MVKCCCPRTDYCLIYSPPYYQERMRVAKERHYICILTIVETLSGIIPYKEIHLSSISTVKYMTEQCILLQSSKMKKLKKKVMYIEKRLKELDLEVMELFDIKEVETVEQHICLFTCVIKTFCY